MPEIIVTISPKGEIQIEGQNFKGISCEQATRKIEEALGKVVNKKHKPEYYETEKIGAGVTIKR